MALRRIPVRQSGNRPNLFMGGDREGVMLTGLAAAALVVSAQSWEASAYGLALWFGGLFVFRWLAKKDPLMRQVYLRSRRYSQKRYPARSTPFRDNTRRQAGQYAKRTYR